MLVKLKHVEMLESQDRSLLTRLFGVPSTCSYEAVYMETGLLPVRFILQGRRLMYYWTLLNKSDDELVKKFFNVQKEHSVNDDWIEQIKDDITSLGINLNEQEVKVMKKTKFKNGLKKKLKENATSFLYKYKEKHTKTKHLNNYKFQSYLSSDKLTTNEKKLLFSLRTRSIDVKRNYKKKFKFNMSCSLCKDDSQEETEMHLQKCSKIIAKVNTAHAKYEDIFSEDIEKQIKITKIFGQVMKVRKILLNTIKY